LEGKKSGIGTLKSFPRGAHFKFERPGKWYKCKP
jgi:hypothetical protein